MTTFLAILFIILVIGGLLGSAFYSGMETGMYTINRVRLNVRAGHGDPRAGWLLRLINHPGWMLTTLLLANNIANYASSFGIAGLLDETDISPVSAIFINAGILIPILFIFGEVLPKDLFRTHTDRWTYAGVGILHLTSRILKWTGLLLLVEVIARLIGRDPDAMINSSRNRLGQLLKEGVGAGVLTESQTTLLDRALAMHDIPVTGEMVPWNQARIIGADISGDVRLDVIRGLPHTRLPVLEQDGHVIGILSVLDVLLHPDEPTRKLMKPPLNLPDTMLLPAAMEALRSNQQTLAIVSGNDGQPRGLVTMKDVAEVLTGELEAW